MKKLMKKKIQRSSIKGLLVTLTTQTALVLTVVAVMYFAAGLAGCRATADSVKLLEGDFTVPELLDFAATDSKNVTLRFSEPVTVSAVEVLEAETENLLGGAVPVPHDDPAVVTLRLVSPTALGVRYWMNGIVTDTSGNTLEFSVAFTGYNDQVPILLLSEVRSKNGSKTVAKVSIPQVEFVEFYALSDGNLAGMQLFNAADGIENTFDFPSCEVKTGEYIVVHFGKSTEITETEVDELESTLVLSSGPNATPGRDFYVMVAEDTTKRRISETDILLLRERAGGKVLDVLLTNASTKTAWDAKWLSAVTEVVESGLWLNAGDIASAMDSTKVTTHNRTFSRKNGAESQSGPDAWHLTATSTPGELNTTEPYVAPPPTAAKKK